MDINVNVNKPSVIGTQLCPFVHVLCGCHPTTAAELNSHHRHSINHEPATVTHP